MPTAMQSQSVSIFASAFSERIASVTELNNRILENPAKFNNEKEAFFRKKNLMKEIAILSFYYKKMEEIQLSDFPDILEVERVAQQVASTIFPNNRLKINGESLTGFGEIPINFCLNVADHLLSNRIFRKKKGDQDNRFFVETMMISATISEIKKSTKKYKKPKQKYFPLRDLVERAPQEALLEKVNPFLQGVESFVRENHLPQFEVGRDLKFCNHDNNSLGILLSAKKEEIAARLSLQNAKDPKAILLARLNFLSKKLEYQKSLYDIRKKHGYEYTGINIAFLRKHSVSASRRLLDTKSMLNNIAEYIRIVGDPKQDRSNINVSVFFSDLTQKNSRLAGLFVEFKNLKKEVDDYYGSARQHTTPVAELIAPESLSVAPVAPVAPVAVVAEERSESAAQPDCPAHNDNVSPQFVSAMPTVSSDDSTAGYSTTPPTKSPVHPIVSVFEENKKENTQPAKKTPVKKVKKAAEKTPVEKNPALISGNRYGLLSLGKQEKRAALVRENQNSAPKKSR